MKKISKRDTSLLIFITITHHSYFMSHKRTEIEIFKLSSNNRFCGKLLKRLTGIVRRRDIIILRYIAVNSFCNKIDRRAHVFLVL